jgi:guanylate kinase
VSQGRLVVLAGPTAVGKGTVAEHIRAEYPQVWISVSATTRPPRPGEIDGLHYHFVDDETFERMARDGELLEWAVVHGRAKYGTPRVPVEKAIAAGQWPLLEIDLQGARQVRASMPEALFVFLAPPNVGRTRPATDRARHRVRGGTRDPTDYGESGIGRCRGVRCRAHQ